MHTVYRSSVLVNEHINHCLVFFCDSNSSIITFVMLVNKNYLNHIFCLHLDYLQPYPPPTVVEFTDLVYSSGCCVAECKVAGSCLRKATVQGAYARMRILPDGMRWYGALPPGKSSSLETLIDEICSHIQELTPDDSSLTLTGWHWSCTIYFSLTLMFLSLSQEQCNSVTLSLLAFSIDISKTKHSSM